ncbi:hypothetical protein C8R44DRAFT_987011 [Mycena epipterygia]|nr:hypothetical protein C8R44DRAFT_987011 [Mycena epipterygia]
MNTMCPPTQAPISHPTSDMESTSNPPTTGTGVSSQCEFPPELEHEIFETTAVLYPKTIPNLLRVARRVLFWIEPLLYTAIGIFVFDNITGSSAEMLLARIATKGPEFFSNAVRHMFICSLDFGTNKPWLDKALEKVFRICTGVDHLLLIADFGKLPLLQMLAATDMRPMSIYLMVDLLHPQLDFPYPFFRKVSHLAVVDLYPRPIDENWRHWTTIFRLPALTHLALGSSVSLSLVHAIFTGVPHLEVLLIASKDTHTAALFSEELVLHDVRLVLSGLGHIQLRLHTGTGSLDELWTRAEEFVSRKRSGQIRVSDYYLLPSQSPPQANVQVEPGSGSSPVHEVHVESASGRHSHLPEADLRPADP